jgi:hypothetical protein
MDKFMKKHDMSQRAVARAMAKSVEERTGIRLYSAGALRKRYQRHENKLGRGVPRTKPNSKTAPRTSYKVDTAAPGPKESPDVFQKLSIHALRLAEGLQHWADGRMKPQSEREIDAAENIKGAATQIIRQYFRLGIRVETSN